MNRTMHNDDDFDERGILKDGHSIRVSLTMRDAAMTRRAGQRQQVDSNCITDGTGNPLGLHRPGFRVRTGDNRQGLKDALAEYEADVTNRWRDGVSDDEDHYSDTSTHHGADSTLHRNVDQAYQEYDRQLADAWRQP